MPLFAETMIAFDVLVEINKNPEKFSFSSRKGRHNLYDLALTLSVKKVKSLRGTFDQGRILGFCLASEWDKKNKAFVSQDKDKSIHDLLYLNTFVSKQSLAKSPNLKKLKNIESALLSGFKQGYLLGIYYTNHKKNDSKPKKITHHHTPFRYFKIPELKKPAFQR